MIIKRNENSVETRGMEEKEREAFSLMRKAIHKNKQWW